MFLVTHPDGTQEDCASLEAAFAAGGMNKEAARQYLANICAHDFVPFQKGGQTITACTKCRAIKPTE